MTTLFDDAFGHHFWATDRVLDACSDLTDEQLDTPAPGTYGPISATLHHLIGTDSWYLTFFLDHPNPIDDDTHMTLDELRAVHASNADAWRSLLADGPDGEADVVEHGDGWIFHAPLGFRLAQAIHHGTDHRSQICTALTSLGVEPPQIDVWAYGEATGRSRPEYLNAETLATR